MKLLFALFWLLMMPVAHGIEVIKDLENFKEDQSLGPKGEARLYAIDELDTSKEPVIFVHGIFGEPKELRALIAPFRGSRYQPYILAYADLKQRTSLNGAYFGKQLMILKDQIVGPDRDLTIVAHSMGGVVSREALRTLGSELIEFGKIRLYTVDTPWHGFLGPSDSGVSGLFMKVAGVFMPNGLLDMRARSEFFRKLYSENLPSTVSIHLAFAEEGKHIKDYTEIDLSGTSIKAKNLKSAMLSSVNYKNFERDFDGSDMTEDTVQALLLKHFPRFSGNHDGVLKGNYVDFLKNELLTSAAEVNPRQN